VSQFGQGGSLQDVYAAYGLDVRSVVDAALDLLDATT